MRKSFASDLRESSLSLPREIQTIEMTEYEKHGNRVLQEHEAPVSYSGWSRQNKALKVCPGRLIEGRRIPRPTYFGAKLTIWVHQSASESLRFSVGQCV
jgi:hypothetical protein